MYNYTILADLIEDWLIQEKWYILNVECNDIIYNKKIIAHILNDTVEFYRINNLSKQILSAADPKFFEILEDRLKDVAFSTSAWYQSKNDYWANR